jgi:peptide-methionine (S)-S-oxide reductase
MENNPSPITQTVTLGGGCFWCLEPAYDQLRGVLDVVSGYSGGHVVSPSYEQICTKTTGHAEVLQIRFDPAQIIYKDILRIFFALHDPTTLNRQGGDAGPQYRSVIFYTSEEQRLQAVEVMTEIAEQKIWDNLLVTELSPLEVFYPAEDYHQNYFDRNPNQSYCSFVIAPKVAKFRKQYYDRLKV